MMQKLKLAALIFGIGLLFLGLNLQLFLLLYGEISLELGIFGKSNLDLNLISIIYLLGGFLLIVPPFIEWRYANNKSEKDFALLLIVLETYLVISGILFFWKNDLYSKIIVRILMSLIVIAIIKYVLKQMKQFEWGMLLPHRIGQYYYRCLVGKYPEPAYAMSIGIDWVGLGYAFLEYPFGKIAMVIGSILLTASAVRGYLATRSFISVAWIGINSMYVIYGIVFYFL